MKRNSLINVFSITTLLLISLSACNLTEEIQQEISLLIYLYYGRRPAYQAVSAYGSEISNETPNIDRIAQQGARMDAVYCTNSICGPSRASILTGKFSILMDFIKMLMEVILTEQLTFPKVFRKMATKPQ